MLKYTMALGLLLALSSTVSAMDDKDLDQSILVQPSKQQLAKHAKLVQNVKTTDLDLDENSDEEEAVVKKKTSSRAAKSASSGGFFSKVADFFVSLYRLIF